MAGRSHHAAKATACGPTAEAPPLNARPLGAQESLFLADADTGFTSPRANGAGVIDS